MKTLRNLHTRRLADIDLSRDRAALADLLAEAETAGSAAAIQTSGIRFRIDVTRGVRK